MTALSARAWPLGAAWRRGALLLACILVALTANVAAQNVATTAVPPSMAVQPLYVCKMEVKDLPQFEGLPSPEMTAGNNGLWAATNGMLSQWHIPNNGDTPDNELGIDPEGGSSDTSAGGGDGGGGTVSALAQKPKRRSSSAVTDPRTAAAAPPAAPTAQPAPARAPAPAPVQIPLASAAPAAPPAAAAAPSSARSYIISRPATGSARTYSSSSSAAASAPRRTQQRTRHTLNYGVATAAAAALDEHPWLNATDAAAEATAAGRRAGSMPAHRPSSLGRFERSAYRAAAAAAEVAGMPMGGREEEDEDGFERPPLTSPSRRLFAAGKGQARHVCNKGTATNSTTGPFGKPSFSGKVNNVVGVTMADSGVVPADAAIAVGPNHIVHVVNSMVKILPVNSNGDFPRSLKPGQMRLVPLPDWFGLVASPCDGGYINPSATYDKEVGRFLISAICGGDTNQVLLSVSADSSATGTWILYSFAGEATIGTRMQCTNESYAISFHSQVGYNKDGVYLSFIQNCEFNQQTATGALIYALPKWAVYKGATYFWCPVWTAWDIYDAVGNKNNDDYYPGAFVQMQPVIPQRATDVQADVTYFVSDNLNWVNPLRRGVLTIAALINTGSLWLYEGPNAMAPAPLLVARLVNKGMNCEIQTPDVKLTQPASDNAAGISECQRLDGGAMRPPGVWDGAAVLYANKIYLVNRGPDLMAPFLGVFMPTLYWAIFTPSFCVGGPCGPWFGTDWGWSDGWDWEAGTWQANSDRGRYGFKDPSYYNQVFMFPSSQPPPKEFIQGRRRLQKAFMGAGLNASSSSSGSTGGYKGPIAGSGQLVRSRTQMLAAVRAARAHQKKLARQMRIAAAAEAEKAQPWLGPEVTPAAASPATIAAAAASVAAAGVTPNVLNPAFMQAAFGPPANNSSRFRSAALPNATLAAAGSNRTVHAAFFGGGGWNTNNFMWQGWGQNYYYYDYYQWWREHYFLRNLYMNLRIPPKVNPCKYYKDWIIDNDITFGAINSKHGVIEFVTQGDNPVGLAAPALAVRGGSMLITYSYSGPYSIPLSNGGIRAFPGVGYSVIDVNAPSMSGGSFNLAQAGAGCVEQGSNTRWGSYSGADVHFPSYKIWTAVEYAYQAYDMSPSVSNAGTNIAIFT